MHNNNAVCALFFKNVHIRCLKIIGLDVSRTASSTVTLKVVNLDQHAPEFLSTYYARFAV